jgi:hypothetical protein
MRTETVSERDAETALPPKKPPAPNVERGSLLPQRFADLRGKTLTAGDKKSPPGRRALWLGDRPPLEGRTMTHRGAYSDFGR